MSAARSGTSTSAGVRAGGLVHRLRLRRVILLSLKAGLRRRGRLGSGRLVQQAAYFSKAASVFWYGARSHQLNIGS